MQWKWKWKGEEGEEDLREDDWAERGLISESLLFDIIPLSGLSEEDVHDRDICTGILSTIDHS